MLACSSPCITDVVARGPLNIDQTEALLIASRTVGFAVGHSSVQLGVARSALPSGVAHPPVQRRRPADDARSRAGRRSRRQGDGGVHRTRTPRTGRSTDSTRSRRHSDVRRPHQRRARPDPRDDIASAMIPPTSAITVLGSSPTRRCRRSRSPRAARDRPAARPCPRGRRRRRTPIASATAAVAMTSHAAVVGRCTTRTTSTRTTAAMSVIAPLPSMPSLENDAVLDVALPHGSSVPTTRSVAPTNTTIHAARGRVRRDGGRHLWLRRVGVRVRRRRRRGGRRSGSPARPARRRPRPTRRDRRSRPTANRASARRASRTCRPTSGGRDAPTDLDTSRLPALTSRCTGPSRQKEQQATSDALHVGGPRGTGHVNGPLGRRRAGRGRDSRLRRPPRRAYASQRDLRHVYSGTPYSADVPLTLPIRCAGTGS